MRLNAPLNFAVIGVGGYIAPRHLNAIRETGNRTIAAVDPHPSVGLLDQYSFDVRFFTELGRFARHLQSLRKLPPSDHVHCVAVCSPNYLHVKHCHLALDAGAHVICEKPLSIWPGELDRLEAAEARAGRKVSTILQLRVHPDMLRLKSQLQDEASGMRRDVVLSYVTGRGDWYFASWKGQERKSGGIATNIGIHLFDLLIWLFGSPQNSMLYHRDAKRISGVLELARARVRWFLSVNHEDLPSAVRQAGRTTYRSIAIDGQRLEFSEGFAELHTRVYERTLSGSGFGIADARPSIMLTQEIRAAEVLSRKGQMIHPFLKDV